MDAICLYYTGNLYLHNFGDGDEPFTVMSHLLVFAQTDSFLGVEVFLVFFNIGGIGFVIIAHISKRSVSRLYLLQMKSSPRCCLSFEFSHVIFTVKYNCWAAAHMCSALLFLTDGSIRAG